MTEGHIDEIRAAHPCGLNPPAIAGVCIVPALRGVEMGTDVARKALRFLFECGAIEGADGIISVPLDEQPLFVVPVSVHR